MPIQVGTTVVINDNKELENITDISGKYGNLHSNVRLLGTGNTEIINFDFPVMQKAMLEDTSFTYSNIALGKTAMLILDTSTDDHTPSFAGENTRWASNSVPRWDDYRYWVVTFVALSGVSVAVSASGYDV